MAAFGHAMEEASRTSDMVSIVNVTGVCGLTKGGMLKRECNYVLDALERI